MRKGRRIGFGKRVYPSPSAHQRGERLGYTPLRHCVQCGYPNDTRTTPWADNTDHGGLGDAFTISIDGVTGQTKNLSTQDRNVISGCRFCGSLKWLDSKPIPLPDDRNFPSDEWRRSRRKRR